MDTGSIFSNCSLSSTNNSATICEALMTVLNVSCVVLVETTTRNEKEFDEVASSILSCGLKTINADSQNFNLLRADNVLCALAYTGLLRDKAGLLLEARCSQYEILSKSGMPLNFTVHEPEAEEINGLSRFIQKKHFVVTTSLYEPFQYERLGPNGTVIRTGPVFEILNALAEYVNFDYEVVHPSDKAYGSLLPDGNWSGMIGQVARKEADFAVGDLTITLNRSQVVDFMNPFWEESLTFMIAMPTDDKIALYTYPFRGRVWLLILGSMLVSLLAAKCFDLLDEKYSGTKPTLHTYLMSLCFYIVNQGTHKTPQNASSRMFMSCFWIFTITMVATYTGTLVAHMTMTKLKLPIDSLEELVADPEYQAALPGGGFLEDLFRNSQKGIYKEIWDNKINLNPENFYTFADHDTLALIERMRREKVVRFGDEVYSNDFLVRREICDITLSNERFYKSNFAFAAYKGFPYMDMFNTRIQAIKESGLIDLWMKQHLPNENICDKSLSSIGYFRISIKETIGAFLVLGIGVTVAAIAFVLEFLFLFCHKKLVTNLCEPF